MTISEYARNGCGCTTARAEHNGFIAAGQHAGRNELTSLRKALANDGLTLTAELKLLPQMSAAEILAQAKILTAATDSIQVPDNRNAQAQMSNIAIASILLHNRINPVVHMNARDRNRIALQSDMLGAYGLGVSDLVLLRGKSLDANHEPEASSVYDVRPLEMIATAVTIREADDLDRGASNDASDFFIGAVATVFDPKKDWQPEKLLDKADAGARFIQLQVCMNQRVLRDYMAALVARKLTWKFSVLVGLAVFHSADAARKYRKDQPGSLVPPAIIKRLKQAVDPEAEGILICAEMLTEIAGIPGVAGANLVATGDPATVAAAIAAANIR